MTDSELLEEIIKISRDHKEGYETWLNNLSKGLYVKVWNDYMEGARDQLRDSIKTLDYFIELYEENKKVKEEKK